MCFALKISCDYCRYKLRHILHHSGQRSAPMQNSEKIPEPVFVYPLPAKTQGEHGNSKAYRVSLRILWLCFLLPIIGIVFDVGALTISYLSTNIFIIFFVMYFEFYKNPIFRRIVLLTAVLILPVAHIAGLIIPFAPRFSPKSFGEVYPFIELNFFIGIVFFSFLHAVNICMCILVKKSIKCFIIPIILCEVSSLIFYFISFAIFSRIYESI